MLANSDVAEDEDLKNIAESTAAVGFLGTPHRGSKDMASVGEVARKAASIILDTNFTSLDALGLNKSDLERCQEAFSRMWRAYAFRVKTFQESSGLSSLNVGPLNEKVCSFSFNEVTLSYFLQGPVCSWTTQVVPDISSTLGDSREQAEALVGNYMEICRIPGPEDPNYESIVGELRRTYNSIVKLSERWMSKASPGTQISKVDCTTQDEAIESGAV